MSDFYGQEYFYPGMFAPEAARAMRDRLNTSLWPLLTDLCRSSRTNGEKESNKGLFIGAGNVQHINGDAYVMLTNSRGMPIFQLKRGWTENNKGTTVPEYELKNWFRNLKDRGKDRTIITSTNRAYIVKHMIDMIPQVMEAAAAYSNQALNGAITFLYEHMDEDTNNAAAIGSVSVPPDAYYSLLSAMFNPAFKPTDIPNHHEAKLKQDYEGLTQKFANKKSYADRVKDFFNGEKWLVTMYLYGNGMGSALAITSLKCEVTGPRECKAKLNGPRKLYRNLDSFYEANPDDAESLRSALTFSKVFRSKLSDSYQKCYDAAGLLPVQTAVYEDIGSLTHARGMTPASPHVATNYLLPK